MNHGVLWWLQVLGGIGWLIALAPIFWFFVYVVVDLIHRIRSDGDE